MVTRVVLHNFVTWNALGVCHDIAAIMDQDRLDTPVPTGLFAALRDALLSLILFGLDVRSLCCLSCCSKPLRVWAQQEVLWQHMMLEGTLGPVQFKVTAVDAITDSNHVNILSCVDQD
jgi:hypothetical protein